MRRRDVGDAPRRATSGEGCSGPPDRCPPRHSGLPRLWPAVAAGRASHPGAFLRFTLQMEQKEEETREILLPNWQGSGSHGITLDQTDEGVFVKQVVQNSPAAKTGAVKEGERPLPASLPFRRTSLPLQPPAPALGRHRSSSSPKPSSLAFLDSLRL